MTLKWYLSALLRVAKPWLEEFATPFEQHATRLGFQAADMVLLARQVIEAYRLWQGPPLLIFKLDLKKAFEYVSTSSWWAGAAP